MKTHEIARVLSMLAKYLKDQPNVEWTDFSSPTKKHAAPNQKPNAVESQDYWAMLQSIGSLEKKTLLELIERFRIPVKARPRDGAIDLLKKISNHIKENPNLMKSIEADMDKAEPASKALMGALSIILRESKAKVD